MPQDYPRRRVITPTTGITRTKQSEEAQANINAIVKRYRSTQLLPAFNSRPGRYGDVSSAPDFREMQQKVRSAQEAFDSLPPNVRSHFRNDPAELLAAVYDPGRVDELRKLGLVPEERAPEVPAPAAPPAPAAGTSEEG